VGSSASPTSETYRGPAPGSELEVQHMIAFMAARNFQTSLSVHTYSNLWMSPYGYDSVLPVDHVQHQEVSALATEGNGYVFGPIATTIYLANGSTVDQDHGVFGTMAWTSEIGSSNDGFWPAQSRIVPLAEENLLGKLRTALAAGPWARFVDVTLTDLGDGDGTFEPGEAIGVAVAARNSGRGVANSIDFALTSGHASLTVTDGTAQGAVTPGFQDVAQLDALKLQLAANAPFGASLPFTVTMHADGLVQEWHAQVDVGARQLIVTFEFEGVTDEGWGPGSPNDATTGQWERVDPVGTAAQTEDDHTLAGTHCWVTGQGAVGGALGANDVDGGSVTLLSPALDLSATAGAVVSYWRWYSNDTGGAPNADVFQVYLSDDDGVTWVLAEEVGPSGPGTAGGWQFAELDVEQFVSPSAAVRVRFTASDLGTGSIVEAALDDFAVHAFPGCTTPTRRCVGAPNAWGPGATIGWNGTTSLAANDLELTVTGANPSGFGVFFRGDTAVSVPSGNGTLCVGGTLTRFAIVTTDPNGAVSLPLDLGTFTPVPSPGDRAHFQFWYRDLGAAPWNFSDALEVQFCD
jgi:hypothetical protein